MITPCHFQCHIDKLTGSFPYNHRHLPVHVAWTHPWISLTKYTFPSGKTEVAFLVFWMMKMHHSAHTQSRNRPTHSHKHTHICAYMHMHKHPLTENFNPFLPPPWAKFMVKPITHYGPSFTRTLGKRLIS